MLNKAYLNSFCLLPCMKQKCRKKNSDSDFSFVVSFRTFSCNACKMSGDISSTLNNGGNFVNNNFTSFCIEARRLKEFS